MHSTPPVQLKQAKGKTEGMWQLGGALVSILCAGGFLGLAVRNTRERGRKIAFSLLMAYMGVAAVVILIAFLAQSGTGWARQAEGSTWVLVVLLVGGLPILAIVLILQILQIASRSRRRL
jgi:hypothetical protein